tara:strand:+ start:251 stop:658 length:408 start_codon:yes stop_codon:yes gene_type:complete
MLEYYTSLNETGMNDDYQIRKNILKDKFTLEKSDFEKLKQAQQNNEINMLSYQENEKSKLLKENKNIYNMSINSLFTKLSVVSMELLEDLTIFINQKNKNINNFFIIFTKDDRLIYVGILFILLAMSLWFIDITK